MNSSRPAPSAAPQRTKAPHYSANPVEKTNQSPPLPQANFPRFNAGNQASAPKRPQSQQSGQNKTPQAVNTSEKQLGHSVNNTSNLVTRTEADDGFSVHYTTSLDGQNDLPGFVDPTQVFNPFHREHEQRRIELARAEVQEEARKKTEAKAQAEAEAAKRAAQDEAAASRAKDKGKKPAAKRKSDTQGKAIGSDQPQTAASREGQVSDEGDMANEFADMMEKMNWIRSRDPSMFQKLLDNMRGVSQDTPSSEQVSSPQLTQQPIPARQQKAKPVNQTSTPSSAMSQADAASNTQQLGSVRANGYAVVVENNPEGLPDLGRFPAGRRIRGPRRKETSSGTPSMQSTTAGQIDHEHPVNTPTTAAGSAAKIDTLGLVPTSGSAPTPTPLPAPGSTPVVINSAKPTQPVSLSQGLPPKGLNGGTIWPEDKRTALAEAAVRSLKEFALKGYPGNADIEITPADIHVILESNPSYIDLCETLEKKGFRFHRGQFARQLLANVPFLNSPTAAKVPPASRPAVPTTIPPNPIGGPPKPARVTPPPPVMPVQAVPPIHGIPTHSLTPGSAPIPPPTPPSEFHAVNGGPMLIKPETQPPIIKPYSSAQGPSKGRKFMPPRNEPQIGSKEAMSRKRDFSELIDLTSLSDNEHYVLSKKQPRTEKSSPEPDIFQQYERQMMSTAAAAPLPQPPQQAFPSGPIHPSQPYRFNPTMGQPAQNPPRESILNGLKVDASAIRSRRLAKPINRTEGLEKNYYDPKTVARDILIAAGRHAIERPLNAHMAGLLGRHIDIDSDLATFDWDAVDPGGPPVPMVEYVDFAAGPPQTQPAKGDTSAWKEKSGRLPISDKPIHQPNRSHVVPPPAPSTSLPSESRTNHIDKSANSTVKRLSSLRHSQVPGPDVVKEPSSSSSASSQPKRAPNSALTQPEIAVNPKINMSDPPIQKRRGRPPGSKSKTMSVAAMQRAARQVTSVTSPSLSGPHLPTFRCRWKGCRTSLHNSEILHQHISKVHGQLEEGIDEYACWWKKCQFLKEDSDGMFQPVETFAAKEDWLKHVQKNHIYPITLKQGDGPSTKRIGKHSTPSLDVSRFRFHPQLASQTRTFSYLDPQTILMDSNRYLSDENGRTTTPMVSDRSNTTLKLDTMTLIPASHGPDQADQAAQRSFLKTHRDDKRSPHAIAEETLRALIVNKTHFGPGMKDEGCVLARESVKSRLEHNPGIVKVTDATS